MRLRDRIGVVAVTGLLVVGTVTLLWGRDGEDAATAGRTVAGYDCQGAKVSLAELDAAPYAASLPESAQKAFPALTSVRNVDGYRVQSAADGNVTIAKLMSAREGTALGPWRTNFQMATIESQPSGGSEAHGWWYVSDITCQLQRSFPGLERAAVRLDPAYGPPGPGDTVVHLLVSERNCGLLDPDRIKVAELVRSATEVRIAVAITPPEWDLHCRVPAPAPFSVDLGRPLGEERVLDSAAHPARPFDRHR